MGSLADVMHKINVQQLEKLCTTDNIPNVVVVLIAFLVVLNVEPLFQTQYA